MNNEMRRQVRLLSKFSKTDLTLIWLFFLMGEFVYPQCRIKLETGRTKIAMKWLILRVDRYVTS